MDESNKCIGPINPTENPRQIHRQAAHEQTDRKTQMKLGNVKY